MFIRPLLLDKMSHKLHRRIYIEAYAIYIEAYAFVSKFVSRADTPVGKKRQFS
jgi:hypothetical protein